MKKALQSIAIFLGLVALLALGMSLFNRRPARSPADVLGIMRQAVIDGNTKVFLACFEVEEYKPRTTLVSMRLYYSVVLKFERAMVETYGEPAAQYHGSNRLLEDMLRNDWGEKFEIIEDDQKATLVRIDSESGQDDRDAGDAMYVATPSDRPIKLYLNANGQWMVNAESVLPLTHDIYKAGIIYRYRIQGLGSTRQLIGQPGYDVARISEKLAAEMFEADGLGRTGVEILNPYAPQD